MKGFVIAGIALLTVACGGMQVRRVPLDSSGIPANSMVEGLRVQVPVPNEVVTVVHHEGERVVGHAQMSLPARCEVYELDFKGAWLKSRELGVAVHTNGALKDYSFTTTDKSGEGIQQSADAVNALREAAEEIQEAQKQPDPVASENEQLELEILNFMLQENKKALEEGRPLPYPEIVGIE
jgi:hypothetical protein